MAVHNNMTQKYVEYEVMTTLHTTLFHGVVKLNLKL